MIETAPRAASSETLKARDVMTAPHDAHVVTYHRALAVQRGEEPSQQPQEQIGYVPGLVDVVDGVKEAFSAKKDYYTSLGGLFIKELHLARQAVVASLTLLIASGVVAASVLILGSTLVAMLLIAIGLTPLLSVAVVFFINVALLVLAIKSLRATSKRISLGRTAAMMRDAANEPDKEQ